MYNKQEYVSTTIERNEAKDGEMIETQLERMTTNGEPIKAVIQPIHTVRSQGVLPETDIRTDRFEEALAIGDKITASKLAQRDHNLTIAHKKKEGDGGAEPIQGEGK